MELPDKTYYKLIVIRSPRKNSLDMINMFTLYVVEEINN